MLFNLCMKLLGEVVWSFEVQCHQCTDETQRYLSFPHKSKEAVSVLNQRLVSIMDWMIANELKLNPNKAEVHLVSQKTD